MTLQEIIAEAQKLSLEEREQLMDAIRNLPDTKEEATIQYSLLDLAGLGAEIWKDVDAQAYIDQLRDEWDS